jgi:hypothetical protein
VQAVFIELPEDEVGGTGDFPRGVKVFNAQQPLTAVGPGVEKACQGGE